MPSGSSKPILTFACLPHAWRSGLPWGTVYSSGTPGSPLAWRCLFYGTFPSALDEILLLKTSVRAFVPFALLVRVGMPPARPKPSEIAAEAKRIYHPYIEREMTECPVKSYIHVDSSTLVVGEDKRCSRRTRIAIIDGDPVDVALDWCQLTLNEGAETRIPVVNMANEKRAGGDWESGLMAPEECFARRSNLVHALLMPWDPYSPPAAPHYPIPQRGGLYSPSVGKYTIPKPARRLGNKRLTIGSGLPRRTRLLPGLVRVQMASSHLCRTRPSP